MSATAFLTSNETTGEFQFNIVSSYPSGQGDISANGSNFITLAAGGYLIRYYTYITNSSDTVPQIDLYLNGMFLPNSTRYGFARTNMAIVGEYVFRLTNTGRLQITHTSSSDITYSNTYCVVQRLGV